MYETVLINKQGNHRNVYFFTPCDIPENVIYSCFAFKATTGVCEACFHQVHRPCASGAIKSQTYGNV